MLVLVLWLVGVFVRVVRELGVVRGWSVEQEPSQVAHVVSLADGDSIAVGGAGLTVLAKR
jgi:riboflavin synthase alpha subunit